MNDQSTAELERDAEIARAKVAQTAESIRSRMTPGQLIDEFTGVFSGGDGMAALGNLKTQIRDNPLPLTLIGTGLAWLVLGQGPGGAAPPRGASTSGVTPDPSSTFAEYGSRDDLLPDSQSGSVADTLSEAARTARSAVTDAADTVRDNLDAGKQWVQGTAQGASAGGADFVAKGRQSATELIESEPLILAALGLAVGTAIGAMLPRTSLEDQQLGSYSDAIRNTAQNLMEKGVEGAKEVAAEAYQTVKDEADRQGVSGAGDGSIVEKVAEVVRSTASKTEQAMRDPDPSHAAKSGRSRPGSSS